MADVNAVAAPPPAAAAAPSAGQGPQGGQEQQQQQGGAGFDWRSLLMQVVVFWFLQTWLMGGRGSKTPIDKQFHGLYTDGVTLSLKVFLTEKNFTDGVTLASFANTTPTWELDRVVFGDWEGGEGGSYGADLEVPVPQEVQRNGTWWVHAFMMRTDEDDPRVLHTQKAFTRYLPLLRTPETKNLLSWGGDAENKSTANAATTSNSADSQGNAGSSEASEADASAASSPSSSDSSSSSTLAPRDRHGIVTCAHANLTLSLVYMTGVMQPGALPAELAVHVHMDNTTHTYDPVFFVNDFWKFTSEYQPLNDTTPTMKLLLRFDPLSMFKWQMQVQMESSFQMNMMLGSANAGDEDVMKRMLLETNPYLLGLTSVVTLLHTVFDFLAFKNTISFWRERKSMTGISVRSIVTGIAVQFIIFLYLLDQETSWLVLGSTGVGIIIEGWKLRKAMSIQLDWNNKVLGIFPRLNFGDKPEYRSTTKEYDDLAFKYVGRAVLPLLAGYAVYSLVYHEHKGWYSYVIGVLAGAVYSFGFIMMTPQLFINYKLKSVAHLPWRMLTYKALNTFIDDLFAFIIKMPTLHRLACFRDDIIFLIYLYQRWCYPVDLSRTEDRDDDADKDKDKSATNDAGAGAGVAGDGVAGGAAQDAETKKTQ